ncbi:MAG TPA: peptide ABC transporter substrate-binding protein [Rhizomicrobium sp.]|jgi:oligopeptide transport system substrate-binding protein|nr:peptide ABC transporter substrate-binding protein [Rhizomicrobium sp.]
MRTAYALLAGLLALLAAPPATALVVLNRGNGAEIKSLDPHFIDGINESSVDGDLLIGLLTVDAMGAPIPGAATRWETSPDGKTWTFHLRDHVWSDGRPVTAADFVFAWRRLLDPKTGAAYAYNLWVVKNAHAVSEGRLPPSALGVRAPDDKTFVVDLEHPAAYLPELLTHDTAYPLPRHVLLARGNAWSRPGTFVGNGPYVPREWVANDHLTLVKNPRFYDAAHVHIDVVNYYPTPDSEAALRRLRAGELDTQTPIPLTEIGWLRRNMPAIVHTKPFLGLSYISINLRRPPLTDLRLRRALNLAFDRETITERVLRLGEPPAYSIVPPTTANYPKGPTLDFRTLAPPARLAKAQWLMAQLGYGPDNHLRLGYETFDEPNNKRIAAVMQAMFRQIWVDLDISVIDAAFHTRNMQTGNYDLGAASWFADFNDASNFLDLLRSDGGNNYGHYRNLAFDRALDAAQQEPDAKKRGALLAAAEAMALKDEPWIPMRFRTTQDLVQPYVKGWMDNSRDMHRSRWLWLDGKPASR